MPYKPANSTDIRFVDSLGLDNICYIDVRSPAEYAADHIPGACNLPLFDDAQRAKIGAIYHQIGQGQARLAGLELAAPRLSWLLEELAKRKQQYDLLLHCWRGGLRSQAVQEAAAAHGIACQRLNGGYREYRRWVVEFLSQALPFRVITLHGLTGCGKTAVLQALQQRYGLPVLDLERLAQHRGSVFGHIGFQQQPSQKYFESLLVAAIRAMDSAKPLLLEGESRRVGSLLLPTSLYSALKSGRRVLLYDSVAGRARRLLQEYRPERYLQQVLQALDSPALQAKFSAARLNGLAQQVEAGAYTEAIEYLLTHYYDPLYHDPDGPAAGYDLCVDSADTQAAAAQIAAFIDTKVLQGACFEKVDR